MDETVIAVYCTEALSEDVTRTLNAAGYNPNVFTEFIPAVDACKKLLPDLILIEASLTQRNFSALSNSGVQTEQFNDIDDLNMKLLNL
jgi:DNA-binding response OmpR family regulator